MIQMKTFSDVVKIINEKKDIKQKVVDKGGLTKYEDITYVKFMFKPLFDITKHIQLGDIYYNI